MWYNKGLNVAYILIIMLIIFTMDRKVKHISNKHAHSSARCSIKTHENFDRVLRASGRENVRSFGENRVSGVFVKRLGLCALMACFSIIVAPVWGYDFGNWRDRVAQSFYLDFSTAQISPRLIFQPEFVKFIRQRRIRLT